VESLWCMFKNIINIAGVNKVIMHFGKWVNVVHAHLACYDVASPVRVLHCTQCSEAKVYVISPARAGYQEFVEAHRHG